MDAENLSRPPIVWDEEHTVRLIKAFEAQKVLWNPNNRGYMHRNVRQEAWNAMANVMQTSLRDVRRKMNSLIAVFRWQYRKGVATPRWWASHMAFMMNPGEDDEDTEPQQQNASTSTCDNAVQCDISISNDLIDSENEYILLETRKRCFQSAFQEFRAELEPPQRLIIVETSSSNSINLITPSSNEQSLLSPSVESRPAPDEADGDDISLYVKYLQCKLNKYPSQTRDAIQFQINRILYEADIGLHNTSGAQELA